MSIPQELRYDGPTKQDVVALKALQKGEADEHQQGLVLQLIIKNFSRTYDLTYIPGDAAGSAFLSGRAFVGHRILKYLKFPASTLDKLPNKEPTQ